MSQTVDTAGNSQYAMGGLGASAACDTPRQADRLHHQVPPPAPLQHTPAAPAAGPPTPACSLTMGDQKHCGGIAGLAAGLQLPVVSNRVLQVLYNVWAKRHQAVWLQGCPWNTPVIQSQAATVAAGHGAHLNALLLTARVLASFNVGQGLLVRLRCLQLPHLAPCLSQLHGHSGKF